MAAIGFSVMFHFTTSVLYPPIYTKHDNTVPSVTCYHLHVAAKASKLTIKNRSSRRSIIDHLSSPVSNKYCKQNERITKYLPAYNVLTNRGQYIISCDIYDT
jgi:hypothetical protein